MSTVKSIHAKWAMSTHETMSTEKSLITSGFVEARLQVDTVLNFMRLSDLGSFYV